MNNKKPTTDYDYSEQLAINRRTHISANEKQIISKRTYTIGGKKYLVNSFYDTDSQSVDNGIKRLLDKNFEKAS